MTLHKALRRARAKMGAKQKKKMLRYATRQAKFASSRKKKAVFRKVKSAIRKLSPSQLGRSVKTFLIKKRS